eukprot:CAMPEP_0194271502 /NCGR_PEP_ID=MMETSP0169-20130528/5260_1 /TAXON_ID=218684 /ORGANISM="Corethron pennatum, Strain L29A3" /LENGTH=184 /DNA_ID=CAMNT_0039013859 /DNA_START=58 /DNA_END=612 /DNA_ORIENTATION=-
MTGKIHLALLLATYFPPALSFTGTHGRIAFSRHPVECTKLVRLMAPVLSRLSASSDSATASDGPILSDLQTFLRLLSVVDSGGQAKFVIQDGQCLRNGETETRRAKKLYPGDSITFGGATYDVAEGVHAKGYTYKPKVKKQKPSAKVDADGNLEFGGRYRSEDWRTERKLKKEERKRENSSKKE